tara:strand:- start:10186 stop:10365 length:180 start_codon:yes stop_codon:yes gene_type:complete
LLVPAITDVGGTNASRHVGSIHESHRYARGNALERDCQVIAYVLEHVAFRPNLQFVLNR